jgi:serine protease AprX
MFREGKNPNPDLRPHTTGHSYGCRISREACDWAGFERSLEALKAAGVMTVASAGNRGPRCNTVTGPPGSLLQAFTVGSLDHKSAKIASYSSRGYVVEYPNRRKPDVSAPGM